MDELTEKMKNMMDIKGKIILYDESGVALETGNSLMSSQIHVT